MSASLYRMFLDSTVLYRDLLRIIIVLEKSVVRSAAAAAAAAASAAAAAAARHAAAADAAAIAGAADAAAGAAAAAVAAAARDITSGVCPIKKKRRVWLDYGCICGHPWTTGDVPPKLQLICALSHWQCANLC